MSELVIVGGGPAGLSALRGYRDAGGQGEVVLVAEEGEAPYERPPLTKELMRGESDEADLPIETEERLRELGVRLVATRAVGLDPAARTVQLADGREEGYASCVLATGSEPARLPVPGADDPRVRVIRTLSHLKGLLARLSPGDPVVVIGSGFIGCEAAVSLRRRGQAVTLVSLEDAPQAERLGEDVGGRILGWLHDEGVETRMGVEVEAIDHSEGVARVRAGGTGTEGALVLMAAGVVARLELARAAGLDVSAGAIPTDAHMQTAIDGLLACGDAAQADHPLAGRGLRVEHWGDALAQGETAGRTAAGEDARWETVPGFWSIIGDRTLKYAAWGDGHDDVRVQDHGNGAFTAWYGTEGRVVGVLAHERDEDYERGRELIAEGAELR